MKLRGEFCASQGVSHELCSRSHVSGNAKVGLLRTAPFRYSSPIHRCDSDRNGQEISGVVPLGGDRNKRQQTLGPSGLRRALLSSGLCRAGAWRPVNPTWTAGGTPRPWMNCAPGSMHANLAGEGRELENHLACLERHGSSTARRESRPRRSHTNTTTWAMTSTRQCWIGGCSTPADIGRTRSRWIRLRRTNFALICRKDRTRTRDDRPRTRRRFRRSGAFHGIRVRLPCGELQHFKQSRWPTAGSGAGLCRSGSSRRTTARPRTKPRAFDRVVSVGLCEHIGLKNYPTFFELAHEKAETPAGLFLLHTIGGNASYRLHRCLDGQVHLPQRDDSLDHAIGQGHGRPWVVEDWHNFGPDYDKTLMAWWQNFDRAWPTFSRSMANDSIECGNTICWDARADFARATFNSGKSSCPRATFARTYP